MPSKTHFFSVSHCETISTLGLDLIRLASYQPGLSFTRTFDYHEHSDRKRDHEPLERH